MAEWSPVTLARAAEWLSGCGSHSARVAERVSGWGQNFRHCAPNQIRLARTAHCISHPYTRPTGRLGQQRHMFHRRSRKNKPHTTLNLLKSTARGCGLPSEKMQKDSNELSWSSHPYPLEEEGGGGTKPTCRIPLFSAWKPWDSDPAPQMEL